MPHFYSLLTFFPRTLCTITWVCLGAALGEYEEHKRNQLPIIRPTIPTPTNKPNHTNNTNKTRNTTNNTNTTTTNLTTSQTRFQWLLPDSASYCGKKNGRVAFTRIHFMFCPLPLPLIFSSVLFLLSYLSYSFCQVYFWIYIYIVFLLFNCI